MKQFRARVSPFRSTYHDLPQAEHDMATSTTVLIVSYNEDVGLLIRTLLEGERYQVINVSSVFETLETIRTRPPNLVIFSEDFLVPQGGWIIGEQIWDMRPDMPIVILAGSKATNGGSAKAGRHRLIATPIEAPELLDAVAALVKHRE